MFDIQREEIDWGGQKLVLETVKLRVRLTRCSGYPWRNLCSCDRCVSKHPKPASTSSRLPSTIRKKPTLPVKSQVASSNVKASERKETLTSRLIDRPIRPLFVDGYKCETQIIITVVSHDMVNDPDIWPWLPLPQR